MRRGEIWWASLGDTPKVHSVDRRSVLVVQSDEFNDSAIPTVLCAALSNELALAEAPGNVRVSRRASGLDEDTVVNIAQIITVDKKTLSRRVGRLPLATMRAVDVGLRLVLALSIR